MFFLLFGLNWISIRDFIHSLYICIGMYLEYYSIKRFFLSFGENFVIFLIFCVTFERFLIGF
ncbi:hypothetical protein BGL76_03765 [Helicobacter pylori]|nr:hypothetical protein BGL76_03765 [Helicobacter pylori]